MKKTRIIFIIISILIVVGIVYYLKMSLKEVIPDNNLNTKEQSINTENKNKTEEQTIKGIINTTADKNVNIYTSPDLGVKFEYAVKDPFGFETSNKVTEKDNTISILEGGGSIKVISKDPKISLEDAIKKDYNISSCKIIIKKVSEPLDLNVKIALPDAKDGNGDSVYLGEGGGDIKESEKDKKCVKEGLIDSNYLFPVYFAASSKYSDKYIAVDVSTQSVDAVLRVNNNRIIWWMTTIEFIK